MISIYTPIDGTSVHFTDTTDNKMVLKEILEEYNPLFRWFSALYLPKLAQGEGPHDDELHLARQVMQDLYIRSGREIPSFFPDRPLESIYDPDRALWEELYKRQKQAKFSLEHKRLTVEFRDDLQRSDLTQCDAALPQIVKWDRRGRTMAIDNPDEFFNWLGENPPIWFGQLGRLFRRRRS